MDTTIERHAYEEKAGLCAVCGDCRASTIHSASIYPIGEETPGVFALTLDIISDQPGIDRLARMAALIRKRDAHLVRAAIERCAQIVRLAAHQRGVCNMEAVEHLTACILASQ